MLASPIHKFVLLMPPKTGTTSLNKAFTRYAHVKVGGSADFKHLNYVGYRDMFGDYFEKLGATTFVVVRPTIDNLKSWYTFRSDPNRYDKVNPKKSTANMTFQEFLDDWNQPQPSKPADVVTSVEFCLNYQGRLPSELTYIRYSDISKLGERLSKMVGTEVKLPWLNKSKKIKDANLEYDETKHYPRLEKLDKLYDQIVFD